MARAAVPYLHFQLMDTRSPAIAAGLPFRFARSDGSPGVPANGQPFSATAGAMSS